MIDLLPLTLEGKEPAEWQGETPQLRWRWLGEGVLELTPRQLPSKYLYDALGSALFEAITTMPWYPLKRAEERLLRAHAAQICLTVH